MLQKFGGKTWDIDIEAVKSIITWGNIDGLIEKEIEDMHRLWPKWILTAGEYKLPIMSEQPFLSSCRNCGNYVVFKNGLRCVSCNMEYQVTNTTVLAWYGIFILGIQGLDYLRRHLEDFPIPSHPIISYKEKKITPGEKTIYKKKKCVQIPINAFYPPQWPVDEPMIHYLKDIFNLPNIEWNVPSHHYHMLAFGRMCLYNPNSFVARTSMGEVIIQRAFGHSVKLLNYCNGDDNSFYRVFG